MNSLGVVNIKWQREPDKFLYVDIMRPHVLGNPFRMKNNTLTERKRVIEEFRQYLWKEMQKPNSKVRAKLEEIAILKDCPIRFVCCCAPSPCHGDVIVRAIEWLRNINEIQCKGCAGQHAPGGCVGDVEHCRQVGKPVHPSVDLI